MRPNGKHMAAWTPKKEGKDFELSCILEPLRAVQKDLLVLSGLSLRKADANGDGPGDHARAMATFLTGRQARKTDGADLRAGISADQVAAAGIGRATALARSNWAAKGAATAAVAITAIAVRIRPISRGGRKRHRSAKRLIRASSLNVFLAQLHSESQNANRLAASAIAGASSISWRKTSRA